MSNGYTNRETWKLNLWLNSDEGIYKATRALVRRYEHILTAWDFEQWCHEVFPNGTCDLSTQDMDEVNYQELLDTWIEAECEPA